MLCLQKKTCIPIPSTTLWEGGKLILEQLDTDITSWLETEILHISTYNSSALAMSYFDDLIKVTGHFGSISACK